MIPIQVNKYIANIMSNLLDFSPEVAKRRIVSSIRELDRSDYEDICSLVKMFIPTVDNDTITISARGTYINLDNLEPTLLHQLDNIIMTKLQRIHLDQSQKSSDTI